VRHDWRGRTTRRPRYFATLACDTSIPSFATRRGCAALPRAGSPRASGESTHGDRGPARADRRGGVATPAPIGSERAPMPADDRGGRHDLHGAPPVRPDAREQHPDQPIDWPKARPFRGGSLEHGELMPERENFRRS
jgi:hypothetical protein